MRLEGALMPAPELTQLLQELAKSNRETVRSNREAARTNRRLTMLARDMLRQSKGHDRPDLKPPEKEIVRAIGPRNELQIKDVAAILHEDHDDRNFQRHFATLRRFHVLLHGPAGFRVNPAHHYLLDELPTEDDNEEDGAHATRTRERRANAPKGENR